MAKSSSGVHKSLSHCPEKIMLIRKALARDVDQIYNLIDFYAQKKLLLPRSKKEIEDSLKSFFVACEDSRIIACGSYESYRGGLYEIRSLAVAEDYQRKHVGKRLVTYIENYLKEKKRPKRFFVLTYSVDFFSKLGYNVVAKETLPEKIWHVCVSCPKFESCDEVAMVKDVI